MENVENTTPAVVTDEAAQEQETIAAEELFENITRESTEEEEEQQEAPQQEEQQEEEPELTPEEAHKKAITDGLQTLFQDGWTSEELLAFSKDKTVRQDIAAGKDVIRAAMAYERRQRTAASAKPAAKKSVPTLKSAATSGVRDSDRFDEMTDAEFDAFDRKARAAMLEGKRVRFQ